MNTPKVYSMTSPKSGNVVANQFVIESKDDRGRTYHAFQSYRVIVAVITHTSEGLKFELDSEYWNYSKTTQKYRNEFLGEKTADTRKKIENGEYLLTNLN